MPPDILQALESVCASLAKLPLRLYMMEHSQRRGPDGLIENHPLWTVGEIQPPSKWLSGYPDGNALSGAVRLILRVQVRLLAAIASGDPIDRYWACRVLQHLGGECAKEYSPAATRLAAHFWQTHC